MKLRLKCLALVLSCLAIVVTVTSCSSDSNETEEPKVVDSDNDGVPDAEDDCPNVAGLASLNGCPETEEDVWTVNMTDQQALNVVYFIPTDFSTNEEVVTDITNNMSNVMLYMQEWFKKQMDYAGFGAKTFGLMTNQKGKVNILVVKGKQASTYYGGKSSLVKTEVEAYLAANPEFNNSVHTLVLGDKGSRIGFNGLGKWCFATSEDYSLSNTGKTFDGFELKTCASLGGIMHELGHGLNLPHNCQKASQVPNVALMSYGNHTYEGGEPEKVFLTNSSCAILDVNPLFNKTTNGVLYYATEPIITLKNLDITKNNTTSTISIMGSFTSDIKVTNVYAGFDFVNEGANPPNDNYDEITYVKIPSLNNGVYSFQVEVAYTDLFNGYQSNNKDEAIIEINILTENGFKMVPFKHYYTTDTTTQIPNDDIAVAFKSFDYTDRSSWSITANSVTSNTERKADKMIDGNENSYWHSYWPYNLSAQGPHEIQVNMGATKTVNGIYIFSNRDHKDQYRPKKINVLTSTDGTNWTTAIEGYTVASYNDAERIKVDFSNSLSITYFKVQVTETYTNTKNGEDNLIIAEIDIF